MTMTDNKVVLYQTPDGATSLDVRLEQETVWLTQDQMGELFGRERSVITKHLRNVFKEADGYATYGGSAGSYSYQPGADKRYQKND